MCAFQLICITESWLNPDISTSRTELQGYEQFKNDWQPTSSGKACGEGILVCRQKTVYKQQCNIQSYCQPL